MATEQQIAANRLNAETNEAARPYPLDTDRAGSIAGQGPKTEEGRKRSSMNARRHGVTGQVTTMTGEDRDAHDQLSQALMKDLAPEGAMVTFDEKVRPYPRDVLAKGSTCGRQLAQRIATDSWRLNRISAVEDNLFALGLHENAGKLCPDNGQIDSALTAARVFTVQAKNFQLLTLYEQRINRSLQKNLALLQSLQAVRKQECEAAMKEAAALLKLSEMKGLEYQPQKDGFVFANDQIHASIDRDQRLQRASTADLSKYRPRKFQTQAA